MKNSAPSLTVSQVGITTCDLRNDSAEWLRAGEISRHSQRTIGARREIVQKLLWFLNDREIEVCDTSAIRGFLHYLTTGHTEPGGRWGNPRETEPVRPATVHTYHGHLRTFFAWLVSEGLLESSPMDRIPVPTYRRDQIQPFSADELNRMMDAAKRTATPLRDHALLLVLLDTGCRASEVCGIRRSDLDMEQRTVSVLGKGNKRRTVAFGSHTCSALWRYLRGTPDLPTDPLFRGQRGELTRSGILQLVERIAREAGVSDAHPHRFRHTFAITFLRAGGGTFTLQQILGHTNLAMTQRYCAVAEADVVDQQRRFSPSEMLLGKKR
jgi:site-specific recombinase XerD